MRTIKYADRFIDDVAAIESDRILQELDRALEGIETFPEHGSPNVRESLVRSYGKGLRKVPIAKWLIKYRYLKETDELEFLALVYGDRIK